MRCQIVLPPTRASCTIAPWRSVQSCPRAQRWTLRMRTRRRGRSGPKQDCRGQISGCPGYGQTNPRTDLADPAHWESNGALRSWQLYHHGPAVAAAGSRVGALKWARRVASAW